MKKLTSNQIRQTWLTFFEERGHKIEKGASLIPHNDPTLLWINSGVAALKKYFDGSLMPPSKRITNVQKSIRTNDIENVGHTARHHTFFEMLGNFSIGDYFRDEVIPWAYEILTNEKYFGLPKEKIYVTYYPSDIATKNLWIKQGMAEDHLIPLEGNFWQIGEGPCGPNTEVFFDRGEKYDPENLGVKMLHEEIENDRYIEIWGIVFSQFNAVEGVKRENYKELPSRNIDTGSGLERICCILQETETNFETDLFMPIISATSLIASKPYEGEYKSAYRVIADHIRACVFALSDGESFSNEGRGYVLRRLLRRASRYGQKIGIHKPFLYTLVDTVIEIMSCFYPEIKQNEEKIKKMIRFEEEKFLKTLTNGETILTKMIEGKDTLSGIDAFKLYDTYGFPIELTKEICEEHNVNIDLDGFKNEMKRQKEMARAARSGASSMSKQSKDLMEFLNPSEFDYFKDELVGKVIGLFKDGEKVDSLSESGEVIFDKTPFYALSGGQIEDNGEGKNDETMFKVTNVIKAPNKQHLHSIKIEYGSINVGDEFVLTIDKNRRRLIERNHSATHLLQAALDKVLDESINQAGSYVCDEYVHFDFNYDKKITKEEIETIEKEVNEMIISSIDEETLILDIEDAKKIGAKALFDEKYGDKVRVVTFKDVSKEFCGGTHVKNTSEIGLFLIEFETSVASGTRRIQFRTSKGAYELAKNRENILYRTALKLNTTSYKEVEDRLSSLVNEREELKKTNEALNKKLASSLADIYKEEFSVFNGHHLLIKTVNNLSRDILISVMDSLKVIYEDYIIILVANNKDQLPICVALGKEAISSGLKAGQIVATLAKTMLGSGGGRPDIAFGSGKDASKLSEAIELVKGMIN